MSGKLPAVVAAMAVFACIGLLGPTSASSVTSFEAGQEWSIKSASATTAKVIIGRVEPWNGKICVNVSIVDIPVSQGGSGKGSTTEVAHIPFEEAALAASVGQLLGTNVPPSSNFERGYKQWRDAKGGVFTVSVEKAIELMFQAVNRKPL